MVVYFHMDYSKFREIEATDAKLDFWINKNRNVMMFGKHGVGKSSLIMSAFERNGLILNESYKMFSGGTLDPWVDFIGIPKKVTGSDGADVLGYIRPEYMNDKLEAIFMDEYNRTSKAVRNALMELIQFKSINGRSFPNLKMVWAACNPDGQDAYDVEEVDPAQGDRFQIIINLPYKPSKKYFTIKYDANIAEQAINWWDSLPEEAKELVSPRRLDYAIEYIKDGGDVAEILPVNSNITSFKETIFLCPILKSLRAAIQKNDEETINKILNDSQNLEVLKDKVFKDKEYYFWLCKYLNDEQLSILLNSSDPFFEWCITNYKIIPRVRSILQSIYDSIENRDNYNKNKLSILDGLFLHKKDSEDKILIANFNAEGMDIRGKILTPPLTADVTDIKNDLLTYINFKTQNKSALNPLLHWERIKNRILDNRLYLSTDIQLVYLFLDYANKLIGGISPYKTIQESFPDLINYINEFIIYAHNRGYFAPDMYYYSLSNFPEKASASDIKAFVIDSTDTLERTHYILNTLGEKPEKPFILNKAPIK
jgi:energy-coupling factor transporter ATP-binding protein EcfA2